MGEKKVGRAQAVARSCVCMKERERKNGRQHHPPRLGGGEDRQCACASNRQTEVEGKWG